MTTLRTFVAAELPPELQQEIEQLQELLRSGPGGRAVNWVNPAGIHLTLKFLGDTEESRLPIVNEALRRVSSMVRPFSVTVAGLGCFPRPNRPRVIWIGLQEEQKMLQRLQQAIENELATSGFNREDRPFQPHLTIGRVRNSALANEVDALGRTIISQQVGELGIITVDHLCLIASTLTPAGAVYRNLYQAPLKTS